MASVTGARRLTPALDRARVLADEARRFLPVPKSDVLNAVRDVLAELGASPRARNLLDRLFNHSKPIDWTDPFSPPIVWPSNERLATDLGCSERTVQMAADELIHLGLIAPVDSPNGKRHGERDAGGRIKYGYGWDLGPCRTRRREFLELAVKKARLWAEYRRDCGLATKAGKRVAQVVEAGVREDLPGDWADYLAQRDQVLTRYPKRALPLVDRHARTAAKRAELELLADMAHATLNDARPMKDQRKDSCLGEVSCAHIQTTTEIPIGVIEIEDEDLPEPLRRVGGAAPKAPERAPGATVEPTRKPPRSTSPIPGVSLAMVCEACPELARLDKGHPRWPAGTWVELSKIADRVREVIGVSGDAWHRARETMGYELAAAAIGVIAQKRAAGLVKCPGGYLRGMMERHQTGRLFLDRSIHGLAAERLQQLAPSTATSELKASASPPAGPPLKASAHLLAHLTSRRW